jgi:hypothetical protein
MANDWINEGIHTYARSLISSQLYTSFSTVRPLFSLLAGKSREGLSRLGDPKFGAFVGGSGLMGMGTRALMTGARMHEFRFQKAQTDAATSVGDETEAAGETPTASSFAEDNIGTAGIVWSEFRAPLKIREDSIQDAMEEGSQDRRQVKIASLIEEAVSQGFQRELDKLQSRMWDGTLTAAQQSSTAQKWSDIIGLDHTVSDGSKTGETSFTIYGTVNRTVETTLASTVLEDPATTFGSTAIKLKWFRQLKYDNDVAGIANKTSGAGDLAITTPALWMALADQVDERHVFYDTSIPQIGMAGFKNPVIVYDGTVIAFDPDCQSGQVYLLTSDSWVYEVHRQENFKMQDWVKKHETEEGGEKYRWSNISAKSRLVCREPWAQAKVTNATAS